MLSGRQPSDVAWEKQRQSAQHVLGRAKSPTHMVNAVTPHVVNGARLWRNIVLSRIRDGSEMAVIRFNDSREFVTFRANNLVISLHWINTGHWLATLFDQSKIGYDEIDGNSDYSQSSRQLSREEFCSLTEQQMVNCNRVDGESSCECPHPLCIGDGSEDDGAYHAQCLCLLSDDYVEDGICYAFSTIEDLDSACWSSAAADYPLARELVAKYNECNDRGSHSVYGSYVLRVDICSDSSHVLVTNIQTWDADIKIPIIHQVQQNV